MAKAHLITVASAAAIIGFAGGNVAQVTDLLGEAKASTVESRFDKIRLEVLDATLNPMTVNQVKQLVCDAVDTKYSLTGTSTCKKAWVKQVMLDGNNQDVPNNTTVVLADVKLTVTVVVGGAK